MRRKMQGLKIYFRDRLAGLPNFALGLLLFALTILSLSSSVYAELGEKDSVYSTLTPIANAKSISGAKTLGTSAKLDAYSLEFHADLERPGAQEDFDFYYDELSDEDLKLVRVINADGDESAPPYLSYSFEEREKDGEPYLHLSVRYIYPENPDDLPAEDIQLGSHFILLFEELD